MGRLTNLNPTAPIADADLPASIARDAEFIAADTAHATAVDPHPNRYQSLLPVTVVQQRVSAPAQITILTGNFFSLGTLSNLNSGESESLFIMTLYIQYIIAGSTHSYWQYSGCCLLSPIWWKAGGGQLVKYIDMEAHNSDDFIVSFRLGVSGQGSRMVELSFPFSLTARLIRATFIRIPLPLPLF